MLDKIGHIKNPLTVIAMFAAIAEVSGAIVLPFIAPENQATYIWFLMLFPVLLVLIFFATLNFNHKALYAPSDWKDESNFFRKFSQATEEERQRKLSDEVAAAEAVSNTQAPEGQRNSPDQQQTKQPAALPGPPPIDIAKLNRERIERYSAAEKSAIVKLATDLNLPFERNVVFHPTKSRRVVFDAVAIEQEKISAVEVKLIFNDFPTRSSSDKILLEAEKVAKSIKDSGREFVLHYVAVLDNEKIDRARVESKLRQYLNEYEFNIKLHVFTMEELGSNFAPVPGSENP